MHLTAKTILFFDTVVQNMINEGGDGDQTIITEDVVGVSKLFDAYLKIQNKFCWIGNGVLHKYSPDKHVHGYNNITYSDNQEAIAIVTKQVYDRLPSWCTSEWATNIFETLQTSTKLS